MRKRFIFPAWFKRYTKRLWITCVVLVVLFAVALSVFRALTPWAAQYKDSLEARLSTLLGTSVSIQDMKTSWYWFEPVLKLDGVVVSEEGNSVIEVKELLVGVDLIRSLWHWRIQPGVLFIEDARLHFREHDAHWQLEGLISKTGEQVVPSTEYASLLDWLLAHQKIVMKRVGVTLHWEDGRLTRIKPLSAEASNHDGHYRVKGHASLEGDEPSMLSLLADLDMSRGFSTDVQGHVFVSAERVVFPEWHSLFNKLGVDVRDGHGEIQLWVDVRNTHVAALQSSVRVRDVAWKHGPESATRVIDRFSANMAWEETPGGWRGTADHIRLKANKTTWPENAMHVDYSSETQTYRVFVKTMLLEPIRQFVDEAALLKPWLALKPRGQLNNTQVGFQAGKLNYVLSRFSHLTWQANDTLPGVKKLSGAVAWEPEEGRLELDSEDVTLAYKNKPPLQFDVVNAAVMWKNLSHGWRVTLDRSLLKHEHGVFTARGMLDGVSSQSKGYLQGNMSFSMHDATFWWPYLPENKLKPKFLAWLLNDVTRIDQASGHVQFEGAREDFPFDTSPGVFVVTGSASGVDLRFNHDWPLTTSIDANIQLDKRMLTADVAQADFQGIPMTHASVMVRDLGLNKEVLSVKGDVEAPCDAMLAYIKTSPLHERLSKLDALIIKQSVMLTLALNFPFYPGPDKLTLQGNIAFQKNSLSLREVPTSFSLQGMEGDLKFDEHGVLESRLSARLFDEPVSLSVQSNHGNEPHLAIDLDGYLSTAGLSKTVSSPVLSFMRGRVPLKSHIMITDEPNDLDHVRVTSSLQGLALDLPEPFGKKRADVVPLTMDAHFNLERGMRLKLDYKQRLSTDLWYEGRPGALQLARGEVVLGAGRAVLRDKPGASIRGEFKTFDWAPWQTALDKMTPTTHKTGGDLQGFRSITLTFGEAYVFGQHYRNMHLHAQHVPDAGWSVAMKDEVVSAELKYDPIQHALKGYISEWVMPKPEAVSEGDAVLPVKAVWNVSRIPNLKLKLGTLRVGDVNAGQLLLKGSRLDDDAFRFDTSELKSDTYTLTFSGDWQASPKNETRVDARLQIHDLEKMLEHWQISPVVEAREGDIHLNGAWDGAPNDFSMKAITGKMHMMFKDGRITHLSEETEKKLGLGKLLSILSLQTIPRRLKLDFSDLSKPGYSFDKFEGNFVLAHGIMETEDSMIDGPVAHATMKGSLNLDKQLYDLSLHISPHITASLPVVATIAGGPVAGLATWVASKLINQGMEKISGYTYDVSGPWLEPVVQQVHIYKKQLPPQEEIINAYDVKAS